MFSNYEKSLFNKVKNNNKVEFKIPIDYDQQQKLSLAINHLSDSGYIIIIECPEDGYDRYYVEYAPCSIKSEKM